jgi:hypothetical protein
MVYPHLVGAPLLFAGLEEYQSTLAAWPNVELYGKCVSDPTVMSAPAAPWKSPGTCERIQSGIS